MPGVKEPSLVVVSDISFTLFIAIWKWESKGVFQQMRCWLFSYVSLLPGGCLASGGPSQWCWQGSYSPVAGNVQPITQWLPENKQLIIPHSAFVAK